MKKVLKILSYFFGSLVFLIVLLLIFYNHIISFSLRKAIENRSEGQVELLLESFKLDLRDGSIMIEEPVLLLNDVFMDENKNITLNKVVFEKIEIERLDVKNLIFKRSILANRFFIDKPEFWITEQGNNSQSSFHPEKLIKTLNQNPDMFSRLLFRIGEIEINYGSIMLTEYVSEDVDPGLVDFTILLENFDSQPETSDTLNRILFSDVFKFKLKNLHKALRSGYMLNIDSAEFNSNYRDLIVGGASLQPTEKDLDQNSVGIKVGQLVLNEIDLEEVRGLEDLNLSSIILSSGELINYINIKSKKKSDTESDKNLDILATVLNDLELDSIYISNFKYLNIRDYKDTVLETHDIGLLMTEVKFDSGGFNNLFNNLYYQNIKLTTGVFAIKKIIPNLFINYSSLSYDDTDRDLKLTGLHLWSDSAQDASTAIDLKIPELQILGGSLLGLQKRKKQKLRVVMRNAEGDFSFTSRIGDSSGSLSNLVFPGYLMLDKIILENGNFNISKTEDFRVNLTRLNFEVEGLKLPEQTSEQIKYDSIRFNYEKAETFFEKASTGISSGYLSYDAGELWIEDVDLKPASLGKDGSIQIQKLNIEKLDLERLLFQKEIQFGQMTISSPRLNGTMSFNDKENPKNNLPFGQMLIPMAIDLGMLVIENGEVNTNITLSEENISLQSNYDLRLGPLYSKKGDTLNSLFNNLHWWLQLKNLDATFADHRLNAKHLLTDTYRSVLDIEGMSLYSQTSSKDAPEKMEIRSLVLPVVEVGGLNYNLLINQDSIVFRRLFLDNPNIDIRLPGVVKQPDPGTQKKFDLRNYLVFSYDTISARNANVSIERRGDSINAVLNLRKFNLEHHYAHKFDGNFINNIGFNFSELSHFDTIKNKFYIIQNGRLGLQEDYITLGIVEGGDMINKLNSASIAGSSGMDFKSEKITLTDITLSETIPSRLKVGKLFIGDFDLKLTQIPSETKKTSFKINLELVSRFSKVMTKLNIDTTVLNDISLTYRQIEDTSIHTINFDSISLVVNKIEIDTAMIRQSRPNLIENLTVDLHGKTRITQDSLYEIQTGIIHYDFPNHVITIDSFSVSPLFDEETFFKKAVYQTTRTKIFSHEIKVNNLDLDKLFNENHIYLNSIDFVDLNAEMYRDKRYMIKPGTFKKLPREALMSISQKFTIDTIRVHNSYLKYKQIEEKSFYPGEIYFTQINGNAYDFTNALQEGKRKNLKIEANGRIMDNARMDVTVFFPLHNDSTAFWLATKTENIDLTVLNSMTTNLLGLGITRGIGSVDAQYISGNDSLATGSLIFRYKKLELKRYNRKKSQLKNKGFINFLINDLVVKSNNPKFARKPRVGQVYFERETEKGVVAYLFRSLLTGLTSTLGFNNKEQRMERKEDRKRR